MRLADSSLAGLSDQAKVSIVGVMDPAAGDRLASRAADGGGQRLELQEELATLRVALLSRDVIGQAKGILMERYGLDADRAFEVLTRLSQCLNVKLRLVAEDFVRTRRLPT